MVLRSALLRAFVLLVSAALVSTALPTDPADAQIEQTGVIPPDSTNGQANFRTFCDFSHAGYDDPIVHPGNPGAAHLHFFFGNTGADAFSTPQSLRTSGSSTCQGMTANRSAYWIPAVFDASGRPVIPDGNNIYYKHLNDAPEAEVQQLPAELRMIAGNADGTAEDPDLVVAFWRCASEDFIRHDAMPACPQGDELILSVEFPPCWDGVNVDSPDHQSHMSYGEQRLDGRFCPDSHPVAVPQIILSFSWDLRDASSGGWYLSSDMGLPAGTSLHADWMNGWRPSILRTWHRECIQELRDCVNGELGDGRVLEPTMRFGTQAIPLPLNRTEPVSQYCNGRLATIVGTNGPDQLTGTSADDVIVGKAGADEIDGGGGNDIICGGSGADVMTGGDGNDELHGGSGNDIIDGNAGNDFISGGGGNDVLRGDVGNDAIRGGGGDDEIVEFGDRNLLMGHGGADTITGGWWIDVIYGGGGDDTITGTGGPDRIYGGSGSDSCTNAPTIHSCE